MNAQNDTNDARGYSLSTRERILLHATQQFRRKGVRGVKMDDVAEALGMSKRTLYEMFGNKENLLLESMRFVSAQLNDVYARFAEHAQSPVEVYVYATTLQLRDIDGINPSFMAEAIRYAPVRQFLDELKADRHEKSLAFLRRCIEDGYLRADLNAELMLELQAVIFEAIMAAELYKRYPFKEIVNFLNYMNFRGQCTEKGLRELERCVAEIEKADTNTSIP